MAYGFLESVCYSLARSMWRRPLNHESLSQFLALLRPLINELLLFFRANLQSTESAKYIKYKVDKVRVDQVKNTERTEDIK